MKRGLILVLVLVYALAGTCFAETATLAEECEAWNAFFTIDEFVAEFNDIASEEHYSIVYENGEYEARWAGSLPLMTLHFGTNVDGMIVKIVLIGKEATEQFGYKMDVCKYAHQIASPHLSTSEQVDDFLRVFANGDSYTETKNDILYSYTLDRSKNILEYSITYLAIVQLDSNSEIKATNRSINKAREDIDTISNGILEALEYWNANDFSTVNDIYNYEAMWKALSDTVTSTVTYLKGIPSTPETEDVLSKLIMAMQDVETALATCSDMDPDGDGIYTGSEMKALLNDTIDTAVGSLEAALSYCEQYDMALSKSVSNWAVEDFGIWTFDRYIDKFQQPTGDYYVRNQEFINGTFSNSATTNAKLSVVIVVDKHMNVLIQLYEYGNRRLKNGLSKDVSYEIYTRDAYGNDETLYASLPSNTDYLLLSDSSAEKFIDLLTNNPSVSFCIEQYERTVDSYLFSIDDTSGFENAIDALILK